MQCKNRTHRESRHRISKNLYEDIILKVISENGIMIYIRHSFIKFKDISSKIEFVTVSNNIVLKKQLQFFCSINF